MTLRDESDSETMLPSRDMISPDVGAPSPRSIQLEEQVSPADEYAPKIRKAYTITKQRERWSEEEHKKFLEALKLHGRAWRRIEEHVGTKTAVQIRSHAQKFFTKVVRETNNGEVSSVKSIEIPPPRPKRKPMHPYPRKLTIPVRNENLAQEKAKSSDSLNLSHSETENQSPTSVLSALGSDALGRADSSKQSESSSPVSSAVAENSGVLLYAKPSDFMLEQRKSSPAQAYASSISDNQACVKLEFTQGNDYVKEYPVEASSTQHLKLFGQTVLITDSHISSSSTSSMEFSPLESECAPSPSTIGAPAPFHYVSGPNGSPRPNESVSSSFLPWGSSYASAAFSCTHVHNPIPTKGHALFDDKESDDKETQKEGSSTGSNGESVSAELSGDRNMEIEAQSSRSLVEEAGGRKLHSLFQRRANFKRVKGFVPYKRCLAERGISSSTLTGEEREEPRTQLCL